MGHSFLGRTKFTGVSNAGSVSSIVAPRGDSEDTIILGGIPTARFNRAELAQQMLVDVTNARKNPSASPKIVVSSNGQVIALYHRDPDFNSAIRTADIVDADGMPMVFITKLLLKDPLKDRVATTDFILDASAMAAANRIRFFFWGARPGIARSAAENLRVQFPALQIVGERQGYFQEHEIDDICQEILNAKTDVLWLGLGSPRQEVLAVRLRNKLPGVAWIRSCGGLFDHIGTDIPRAPLWMQKSGLEWLFRAVLEPRRLGVRYLLTNPVALYHLLTKTSDT